MDQQRYHFLVAGFTGHEDRRSLVRLTANVGVGSGLEQKTQHVDVTVGYRAVQSRDTLPAIIYAPK